MMYQHGTHAINLLNKYILLSHWTFLSDKNIQLLFTNEWLFVPRSQVLTLWFPNLLLFVYAESDLGNFTCILDQTVFRRHIFACLSFQLQDSAFCLQEQVPGFHSLLLLWSPCLLRSDSSLRPPAGCHGRGGAQASSCGHFLPFSPPLFPACRWPLKVLLILIPGNQPVPRDS